jgi:glycosyltransferase involved in cell wall biosynthesis
MTIENKKKITQILYSGLGGHASVAFSLTDADEAKKHMQPHMLFYGVEQVKESYVEKCKAEGIEWNAVQKNEGFDVASYQAVFTALKRQRPEVIILHSVNLIWLVYAASKLLRFRIIAVEHQANHLKTRNDWLYSRLCLLLADKVVYLTEAYKAEIKQKLPKYFNGKKTEVISNGIDVHYFKPACKPNNLSFVFGMLSRINDIKDHTTLLRAFALLQHPSAQLIIAGEGPQLEKLKALAYSLHIADRVSFPGLLEGDQILHFFHRLNVYVHASLGETMSTAIMQAMACSLPIIASDVHGINNMISHEHNGLLVAVKDPESMRVALLRVIQDQTLACQLSAKAREHAEMHYSNEVMAKSYLRLLSN